jgi:putative toxin-antitoxin system antitoxin component (TIGR02293 family)
MAEREHTEHASKRRSKGSKAHEAGELMRHRTAANVSITGDDPKSAVPGGTPIAVAVGALVLGKMFGGGSSPAAAPAPGQPVPTNAPAGSILGGLADLIGRLSAGGVGPQVNSWIGHGANEPVQPAQLGSALGQDVLAELSQRTGMSQQELLSQLSTMLPQIINHMTPNGRMPTPADLKKHDFPDLLTGQIRSMANLTSGKFAETVLNIGSERVGYLEDVSNLFGGRRILRSEIESELDAHELLHRGLPRRALSSLIEKLHVIHADEASQALGVSLRTLQRHKSAPAVPLDVRQSGRAWKFAEILAKATRVFGSQDEAEQWLKRPAIGLDQQRPIDLLTTPAGVKLVEDYLGRLEYGVYT